MVHQYLETRLKLSSNCYNRHLSIFPDHTNSNNWLRTNGISNQKDPCYIAANFLWYDSALDRCQNCSVSSNQTQVSSKDPQYPCLRMKRELHLPAKVFPTLRLGSLRLPELKHFEDTVFSRTNVVGILWFAQFGDYNFFLVLEMNFPVLPLRLIGFVWHFLPSSSNVFLSSLI